MLLLMLCFAAGMLTIVTPCVLPVLPFVLSRSDQPFSKGTLPVLAGLVLSFATVGVMASYVGDWANQWSSVPRALALIALTLCGLTLVWPSLSIRMSRPLTAMGNKLSLPRRPGLSSSAAKRWLSSFGVGAATGLLWAPCAGPILALVLTTVAIQGVHLAAFFLLLAYAAGAGVAMAMAMAIWAGAGLLGRMKKALIPGEWLRRGMGALVLAGVVVMMMGWDGALLLNAPAAETDKFEQRWLDRFLPRQIVVPFTEASPRRSGFLKVSFSSSLLSHVPVQAAEPLLDLPVEGQLPEFKGVTTWLNGQPLTRQQLRGKVVLVDFWTFGCINCQRALPHVKAWAEKYKDQGLVVIGVHAPEFAFERNLDNVRRAVDKMGLRFPVAIDNDFAVWRSFANQYWPANYFIDAQGRIRFHHFGEGEYEKSEKVIQQLLQEARSGRAAG